MPKIKIIKYDRDVDLGYDDERVEMLAYEGFSDWEDVSDEDLKFLKRHLRGGEKVGYIILKLDSVPVLRRIQDIKQWILDEQSRIKKEAAEREAAKIKRAINKKAKTKAKEIEMLQELAKKHRVKVEGL